MVDARRSVSPGARSRNQTASTARNRNPRSTAQSNGIQRKYQQSVCCEGGFSCRSFRGIAALQMV
eukprot:345610-Rhodomonas_salina.1